MTVMSLATLLTNAFLPLIGFLCSYLPKLLHWAGLRLPYVGRVFRDGAVAGELAGMADVEDRLARPGVGVHIQPPYLLLSLHVGRRHPIS
jgi:hypothetical protein